MITPTQDIALQRWDTLPLTLREALFSEPNSDFLWKTCISEHLPNEKIYIVSKVAGYVLLGFLHPEDVAQEVKERVGIDAKTAGTIEEALNKRIFAPLRADIDNVYSPLSKLEPLLEKANLKIIQDIDTQSKIASISPTPKPATLSDIGWSKQPPTQSSIIVKLATPMPVPKPTPTLSPVPTPPQIAPMPKPTAAAVTEPAPMMLHEDTTFKSAEKNVGFTLSKPQGGAEMSLGKGPTAAPARPAVLEFGGAISAGTSVPRPPTPASNSARPMTTNIGTRNVSQIVLTMSTPVPKPPMPPQAPPKPPTPPSASIVQSDKLIVKDFL